MIHHFEMIGGLELTLMKGKLGEKHYSLFNKMMTSDLNFLLGLII